MTLTAKLVLSLACDTLLVFLEGFDTAIVVMHFLILHHILYNSYKIIFSGRIWIAIFLFTILLYIISHFLFHQDTHLFAISLKCALQGKVFLLLINTWQIKAIHMVA